MRVAAPDSAVVSVEGMSGRKYLAEHGGIYHMTPPDARALVQAGGFRPSIGGPVARGGFECACGFRPYFRRCSRCGGYVEEVVA